MDASHKPYKPSGPVQSILAETLLQEKVPESHFKELRALPKKFSSNTKAGAANEGKIRVNKEVCAGHHTASVAGSCAVQHWYSFQKIYPSRLGPGCRHTASHPAAADVVWQHSVIM
jgi:hypothetical protein